MSIENLPEIFLFRFVPLACCSESTLCMPQNQLINFIVYSVREKTGTAQDRFVYFSDFISIGHQGISSFILYANQTDKKGVYMPFSAILHDFIKSHVFFL